ncbi:uncharacterized protein LOC143890016 isoform X2 [Tasmannia lanceolata]|uniref:uncharacterized protein LOC143890016 isoform X2 n=1 Tax=Tasmannia lanceolata TaxID=3420 RepID=UPI004062C899
MAGKAQRRKEPEGSLDRSIQEKERGARPTTAGVGTGAGAKRLASTVAPNSKDKVFHPDWSVLRTDTAFANPDVAREILKKVVLEKDAMRIEKEVADTAFGSGFASIYQLNCYWADMERKSNMFADTITDLQKELGQANKDNGLLLTKLKSSREPRKNLIEEYNSLKNTQDEMIRRALDDQALKHLADKKKAVDEKQVECDDLISTAYAEAFDACKGLILRKYQGTDLDFEDVTWESLFTSSSANPVDDPAVGDAVHEHDRAPPLVSNKRVDVSSLHDDQEAPGS